MQVSRTNPTRVFTELLVKALHERSTRVATGTIVSAKMDSILGKVVIQEPKAYVHICYDIRESNVYCTLAARPQTASGQYTPWHDSFESLFLNKERIDVYERPPDWPAGRHSYKARQTKTMPEFVACALVLYEAALTRIPASW
jgi:hypothetical protein